MKETLPCGMIRNPVIPGFYSDPSLVREQDDYYLVCSSFEYYPGVPVFHSKDLVNWRQIAYCLTRKSQLPLDGSTTSDGIYAPTIRKHDGLYYMITANRCSTLGNHFYVTAENPEGPFSDPVWILDKEGNSIDGVDPSLFFDEDGSVYFSCVAWDEDGQGIGQARIDLESGRLLEPLMLVWHGTGGTFPEGPHTYRINHWYYLMIAEGGTEYGHKVSIARAHHIGGPYENCPYHPILTQNYQYAQSGCIQGVGHGDLFEAHDHTWWLIVHGFRTSLGKLHHLGRETMLVPVTWTEDGWPIACENGWINETTPLQGIFLKSVQHPVEGFQDLFQGMAPSMHWNYLRNPHDQHYQFGIENGTGLGLTGSPVTLDQEKSPTWLGTRQRHFCCEICASFTVIPQEGEETGITVFQTPEHHYDVVVTAHQQQLYGFLRKKVGDILWMGPEFPIPDSSFTIWIKADRIHYTFALLTDHSEIELGTGRTQLLSTESMQYQNFTGTYFAFYAVSNAPQPKTVIVHSFSYQTNNE